MPILPTNPFANINQQLFGSGGGGSGFHQAAFGQYQQMVQQQLQAQIFGSQLQRMDGTKPEPLKPLPVSAIKVGEIIAYRVWRIVGEYLRSVSAQTIWAPHEPMEGKVPSNPEGGGVYAFKTHSGALGLAMPSNEICVGRVALWGDIVEHELGYRAQFAKIIGLMDGGNIKALRAKYGVAA